LPIPNTRQSHTTCSLPTFPNAEGFKKRNEDVINKRFIRSNIDKYWESWHIKGHGSILPAGNFSRYVQVQTTIPAPLTLTRTSLIITVQENSVLYAHQNRKRFEAEVRKVEPTKFSVMPAVSCRRKHGVLLYVRGLFNIFIYYLYSVI
jgi:hypothetical protein